MKIPVDIGAGMQNTFGQQHTGRTPNINAMQVSQFMLFGIVGQCYCGTIEKEFLVRCFSSNNVWRTNVNYPRMY